MPINILMPALSPTMEVGNLAKWLKKEGDTVKAGDVIAEIETDKATMEVEAVDEGTIGKILVPEGAQDIAVNAPIAILLEEGEDEERAEGRARRRRSRNRPRRSRRRRRKRSRQGLGIKGGIRSAFTGTEARRGAVAAALRQRIGPRLRLAARPPTCQGRRHRHQSGQGHGPARPRRQGRYRGGEVRQGAARHARPAARSAGGAAAAKGMSDAQILQLFEEGEYEIVPHDNVRKVIAKRLVEAKQTIPHFYLTIDTEIDALLALRAQINDAAPLDDNGKPVWKVSVNDMVIKALALSLQRVPDANVTWTEGGMLRHKRSDVGVAVSIPGGLITPVVRGAETKRLSEIAIEMKDLAARARVKRLAPQEYQGGTTAVSNLGMFGIKDFAAVINPPHATILAVGAGIETPVVRNGKVEIRTIMTCTLSTDHRAVDGALGAQLINAFKDLIEKPAGMLA